MNSKEIKTRGFREGAPDMLANRINDWLANNDVEVIDIKITSTVHHNGSWVDALVIYK